MNETRSNGYYWLDERAALSHFSLKLATANDQLYANTRAQKGLADDFRSMSTRIEMYL